MDGRTDGRTHGRPTFKSKTTKRNETKRTIDRMNGRTKNIFSLRMVVAKIFFGLRMVVAKTVFRTFSLFFEGLRQNGPQNQIPRDVLL